MPLEVGSDVVTEIKSKLKIPDVLAMVGIQVKPGKRNVKCFFPGHSGSDSTPSCSISHEGDLAHCFGCNSAGDIFSVWQAVTGQGFREALRELGDRAGVEVKLSREERERIEERRVRRSVLAAALKLSEWCLWNEPGEEPRAYLAACGITADTARDLHLGWFPGWTTVQKKLAGVGGPAGRAEFRVEDLDAAGLLGKPRDDGTRLDQLAHCLVYPTFLAGEVTYLKGRVLKDGAPQPKGHMALDREKMEQPAVYWPRGRAAARNESVLLVEGEKDAAVCHQAVGGDIVVCAMVGASRTTQVVDALQGCRRVVLLTDVDFAGNHARNVLAMRLGVSAHVARLEYSAGGKDPADHLRALIAAADPDAGRVTFAEQLRAAIAGARRFLDLRTDEIVMDAGGDPGALAQAVREELAPALAALPDLDRAAWLAEVSARTKLPRAAIASAIREEVDKERRRSEAHREERDKETQRRKVEDLLTAFREHFVGLYFERLVTTGRIAVWSKRRREIVLLDLERFSRVTSVLAPDLGDVEAWVLSQVPDIQSSVVAKTAMAALQDWANELHPKEGLEIISEGVHVLPDMSTVIVDGRRMFRFVPDGKGTGEWTQLEHPIVIDAYMIQAHPTADAWLPKEWDLDTLRAPLKYGIRDVIDHLRNMLEQAWKFREEVDLWLHALLPATLILSSLWTWRPLVHIRARRRSGKSMLAIGWYAGEKQLGMPGWVPCSVHSQDVSASGVTGRLGGSGLTLILDEFEGSEQEKYIKDVLRMLRASRMGGAGKLRGTIDQGFKSQRVDVACIAASIQPISENDADASRWLVTELDHDPTRDTRPSESVQAYLEVLKLDAQEMRRTLMVGFLPHVAELKRLERELARAKLPGQDLVDSRWLENVIPCLAIAKVAGFDPRQLVRDLITGHVEDYQEVENDTIGERLARALLYTPFALENSSGHRETVTLAMQLEANKTSLVNLPAVGIWISEEGKDAGTPFRLLNVNWTSARITVLARTEFGEMSERRLSLLGREVPGWHTNSRPHLGSDRRRLSKFRLSDILNRPDPPRAVPPPREEESTTGFGPSKQEGSAQETIPF